MSHSAKPIGAVGHSAKGLLALWPTPPTGRRPEIPRLSEGRARETLHEWLTPKHPVWSAAATFRERREYLFDRTARSPHIRTVRFTAQREFEHWCELR